MNGAALSAAVCLGHMAACAQQYPMIRAAPAPRFLAHATTRAARTPCARGSTLLRYLAGAWGIARIVSARREILLEISLFHTERTGAGIPNMRVR